jgi:hypothetical protein
VLFRSGLAGVSLVLPTSLLRTGRWIPDVFGAIRNPGGAYATALRLGASGGRWLPVELMLMVLSPLLALVLPLTIYYWKDLSIRLRLLALGSVAADAVLTISTGRNKGLVDIVLIGAGIAVARLVARRKPRVTRRPSTGRRTVLILVSTCLLAGLVFTFFSRTQETRSGAGTVISVGQSAQVVADWRNPFIRTLPRGAQRGAIALSAYLSQGYYGLSLALDEPFVPSFGVGNSQFLFLNAAALPLLEDVDERPYPIRVGARGWDPYGSWSTIYPWIASDVSFPGTVLVMVIVGWLLARSWVEALDGRNPLAAGMLAQMVIVCAYIPANNQALQSGGSLVAFIGILVAWLRTRGRRVDLHGRLASWGRT